MAPHYLVHDEPHKEFIDFVRRGLQPGIDGDDNPVKFICPKKTKAWWKKQSEHRIVRALNHNINVRPATIKNGYLNIFSILVFMSKTYLITQFTSNNFRDEQLPLLNHEHFGKGSAIERDMKEFCETQWMFCPVMFSSETPMDMRKIPRDQILPIQEQSRKTATGNNPKSTIRVVTLYPECHDHDWSSSLKDTVVFKEYHTQDREWLRSNWIRECNAFSKIDSFGHIVKYLDSFEQNNRCFVVLEYASEGSLLELFRRDPPATAEQRRYFLHGMMGLTKAIDKIQNLGGGAKAQRTGFAHRDIKPGNILIFPGTEGIYSSGFNMKLADFDTATSERPIDETESSLHNNDGSRTYCAPEACRFETYQDTTITPIPLSSDIWSLGCVFSEALVWVSGGMAALENAAGLRKREIEMNYHYMVEDFGDCFHNGKVALTCVFKSQQAAVDELEGFKNLSGSVSLLINKEMLVTAHERSPPRDLWHAFRTRYDDLFPTLGRSISLPTKSHRRLSPEFASSSHFVTSPRGSESNFHQEPHQRTASNQGKERQTIGGSAQYHPHSSPVDGTLQSPYPGAYVGSGASTRQNFPFLINYGRAPGSPEPGHHIENSLNISTNGFRTSHTMASPDFPSIGLPNQDNYHQSPYQSPINNSWDPDKLNPQKITTVKDAVYHRKFTSKREQLDGYESFCDRIGRRHFIFVIDDSQSMRGVKGEVLEVVETLAWLVRDIDISCPEIRFTSKPAKRYPPAMLHRSLYNVLSMDKIISPVRDWLNKDRNEECNMRHALNQIFTDASLIDTKKPTSVLVLTNGVWEGGADDHTLVEECITTVLKRMNDKGVSDTGFTFQFVSFGDDRDGLARMTYLDDEAPYKSATGNRV
ncbi:serine/threonine protein kinase [Fusarium flagelliforme]|uniref:Serine/threonine protein kinase n=1 Tax=Fusarium flagelliforme TaxID=2675880 RepID=A0A395N5H0_9HYPO|nr:serine/threonine protein kinase [Fusarium flagelliforme]